MKDYYMSGTNYKKVREIAGPTTEKDLQTLKADRITLLRNFFYEGRNTRLRSYHGHDLIIFVGASGPLVVTLAEAKDFSSAVYTVADTIEQRSSDASLAVKTVGSDQASRPL